MAQDKDPKTLNVPPLRFPGFTDEWKTDKLSSYAKKIIKKNKGNSITNVLCNSANLGIIPQSEYFDRDIANSENTDTYYVIECGDFVYNPRKSVTAPYGPVNLYDRPESGIISPLYLCFRIKNISKDFLLRWFKGNSWHKYVYSHGDTGVRYDRVSIKDEIFLNMPILLPSIPEQEKIAKFLSLLDERIATQNKIIEDLKKLKSVIYENIFNSLKGEIFSLVDVAEIIKGKQLNGEFLTETGDYYVMNGGIEPSGYYHAFNVSANTISISEGGNSCGYIQWNSVPFWSGGHCYTLNIKDESIENKYLYHFLKWHEPEIMKLRIGSGLPNIQKKDLERVSIIIPTNSTQKEIIDLVDSIDGKIETEYSFSLLLNHQKTYLLSKLFI